MKPTTIYLAADAHLALRMDALKKGVSMTELTRRVIEDYLKKRGYRLKRRAMPRVGRGNTGRK